MLAQINVAFLKSFLPISLAHLHVLRVSGAHEVVVGQPQTVEVALEAGGVPFHFFWL